MSEKKQPIGPAPETLASMEETLRQNISRIKGRRKLFIALASVITVLAIVCMLTLVLKHYLFFAAGVLIVSVFALCLYRHFDRLYDGYCSGHQQQLDNIAKIREIQTKIEAGSISAVDALDVLLQQDKAK